MYKATQEIHLQLPSILQNVGRNTPRFRHSPPFITLLQSLNPLRYYEPPIAAQPPRIRSTPTLTLPPAPIPCAPPPGVSTFPDAPFQYPPSRRYEEVANLPNSTLCQTHRAVIALIPRDNGGTNAVVVLRGVEVNIGGFEPGTSPIFEVSPNNGENSTIRLYLCERDSESDIVLPPPTYTEATSGVGKDLFPQVSMSTI